MLVCVYTPISGFISNYTWQHTSVLFLLIRIQTVIKLSSNRTLCRLFWAYWLTDVKRPHWLSRAGIGLSLSGTVNDRWPAVLKPLPCWWMEGWMNRKNSLLIHWFLHSACDIKLHLHSYQQKSTKTLQKRKAVEWNFTLETQLKIASEYNVTFLFVTIIDILKLKLDFNWISLNEWALNNEISYIIFCIVYFPKRSHRRQAGTVFGTTTERFFSYKSQ